MIPFAVLGVWIGVHLHHKMSERLFFGFTYLFLILTGTKLIWEGLT